MNIFAILKQTNKKRMFYVWQNKKIYKNFPIFSL